MQGMTEVSQFLSTAQGGDRPNRDAGPAWRLLPPVQTSAVSPGADRQLDATQQRVVDHRRGPLLVLGGPGTGKTTTLVESIAARVAEGEDPGSLHVITFSRRAAVSLRDRIVRRLGRSGSAPRVFTFHGLSFALNRQFADAEIAPRLLSAPEQDFRVRELLAGSQGRDAWPAELDQALPTRGFAAQVRALLARARQWGLDPDQVSALGAEVGRADWQVVGEFMSEYLDVLDAEGVLDHAELVHRSRILLASPLVRQAVAAQVGRVFVDEFHDVDPAQTQLLLAYAGAAREIVAFADPDQSVYGFRGADARALPTFQQQAGTDDAPVDVATLGINHRQGPKLAKALSGLAWRLPLPPSAPSPTTLREPRTGERSSRIEAWSCASPSAEASQIAELLRSAHLRDGVAWSDMAVLVRSGQRGIGPISRALSAAGVPIEVAGDEIGLAAEDAVRTLLLACQAVAEDRLDVDQAHRLLSSPLAGLDSLALRRLGRSLRRAERAELGPGVLPAPAADLVHRALLQPELLAALPQAPEVLAARDLARLLATANEVADAAGAAVDVLWALWDGTTWPQRLRTAALSSGQSARRAHRDLDAVVALFDIAERASELTGRRGLFGLLAEVETQQIPADSLHEEAVRGAAVRVLTAHRAKGLEWDLVVVAGAQEGVWPDLRRPDSLLEPSRLGSDGMVAAESASARLAAERRLFYVACSRARKRLVVTAVVGTEGEGDQPSRFIGELGLQPQLLSSRPARALQLTSMVGELRRVAVDPAESPEARDAAVQRLAVLADARDDDGRPLVPAADPAHWWGLTAPEVTAPPVERARLVLSGSEVESLRTCPRRWFLGRRARADRRSGSSALFGTVVHALIDDSDDPQAIDGRLGELDRIWDRISFDAHWLSASERAEAEAAVHRWARWRAARDHRRLLGTEVSFRVPVPLAGGSAGEETWLSGVVDRLELTGDGRLFIVDYKTSKSAVKAADVADHDQLGVYQLAAQLGAFDSFAPGVRQVAGAELVFLRVEASSSGDLWPATVAQPSLDESPSLIDRSSASARSAAAAGPPILQLVRAEGDSSADNADDAEEASNTVATGPTWVHDRIAEAAQIARSGEYPARPNPGCRHCTFATSCPATSEGRSVLV